MGNNKMSVEVQFERMTTMFEDKDRLNDINMLSNDHSPIPVQDVLDDCYESGSHWGHIRDMDRQSG